MIFGILGDVNAGKTLFLTYIGYLFHKSDYKVWCNYYLNYPNTKISRAEELGKLDVNDKNIVLLDEVWLMADSRSSMSYGNIILGQKFLQSRKRSAEVFYTTQNSMQVDTRIRSVTQIFFKPIITVRDSNDIPCVINVTCYKRDMYGMLHPFKKINSWVYGIHELYETKEEIKDNRGSELKDLTVKYKGFNGLKKDLVAMLVIDDNVSKERAGLIADYIKLSG